MGDSNKTLFLFALHLNPTIFPRPLIFPSFSSLLVRIGTKWFVASNIVDTGLRVSFATFLFASEPELLVLKLSLVHSLPEKNLNISGETINTQRTPYPFCSLGLFFPANFFFPDSISSRKSILSVFPFRNFFTCSSMSLFSFCRFCCTSI